jgi:hypothetical protein
MAHKELEKVEGQMTLHSIRHARDPENYPSRAERWEKLLEQYPKKGKRRGRK